MGIVASGESAADTLSPVGGAREAEASRRRRDLLQSMLLALAYWGAWLLAYPVSSESWYLPAGLRFTALWLAPARRWPWLFAADALALTSLHLERGQFEHWGAFALATVTAWWSHAIAIRVMRRGDIYAAPESPARMAATLGAMALAALLNAGVQCTSAVLDGSVPVLEWGDRWALRLIGNYTGILVVAPLAFQFVPARAGGAARRRMWAELALTLCIGFGLLLALRSWDAAIASYFSVIALAPMLFMAFRHGWQGAAWALAAISLGFQLARGSTSLPASPEAWQLFVALAGSVALVLGASTVSLRRVNAALLERNWQQKEINARLATQAATLRDLSQRLVRAREDEQRRLAHELHDELGQSVTALGTGISLMARGSDDPDMLDALQAQRELVHGIQASLREVLQGLRPALLDRFGLEAALREGPIRSLLDSAGVAYELRLSGPLASLGPDAASAAYRICQETATNCVRHARARRFDVQIDVAPVWGGDLEVHLRLQDDGIGFDRALLDDDSRGGLRGIRDRILALAGEHRCETGVLGTRHTVWFVDRQARSVEPGDPDALRSS